MGELVLFPMTCVSLEKEGLKCEVAFADSSNRVMYVKGLPPSWVNMDATLGITRLISAGWKEVRRGKAEKDR